MKKFILFAFIAAIIILSLGAHTAQAQGVLDSLSNVLKSSEGEDAPKININNNTHPPIRITPDKSEIVRLDDHVSSILVGNPAHLSVIAESTKLLVLVGKAAGASHFAALDKNGNIIMQRQVIVAAPTENYVRIRKSCGLSDDPKTCRNTHVYYCDEMCHDVAINDEQESNAGTTAQSEEDSQPRGNEGNENVN